MHHPNTRRATVAVSTAFAANGVVFAAFLARTPAIRDTLHFSSAQLGLLLLCLSAGAVIGLPLSGTIVERFGPSRAVPGGAAAVAIGMALNAAGLLVPSWVPVGIGLFVTGLGMGVWDVSMNVEGAAVEQRRGTVLMPRLHALFSLGTVAGAGIGAGAVAMGVSVSLQLFVLAALLPVVLPLAARHFLPSEPSHPAPGTARRAAFTAWREPRTVLIGVMVLGFAFTEGSANDWIAITFVDGYKAPQVVGALAFGVFVTAMTVSRLAGAAALARFGRVRTLRASAALAAVGLLVLQIAGSAQVALAGALLWGTGAALGFPVGMSAAADDPARAAARVSVVSSVGYCAFLAGPPLIGTVAGHTGILRALLIVFGAVVLALLVCGAARPLERVDAQNAREPITSR